MIRKKTLIGVCIFFINICAMTQVGILKFNKKNGSHYLVFPLYYKYGINKCEISIKSRSNDIIYTSFNHINCHIGSDENIIRINLDRVPKNNSYEYKIHVFTLYGEGFRSGPFAWDEEWGNFISIKKVGLN